MTILFDSAGQVKPVHKMTAAELAADIRRRQFSAGTARPNRERPTPYTAADAAWWAANAPSNATGYEVMGEADSRIEARYEAFVMQDRVDAGCVAC